MPNLKKKVYVVTGANSGLGLETSRSLYKQGATVVLACRNVEKARMAASDLTAQLKTACGVLECMKLDLADTGSIRAFAAEFLLRFDRLDCLVCNAGVMLPMAEWRRTEDNFELHVGTNYLGHFLLTNLLLDRLKESAPSRVVIVSSTAMMEGELDVDNLNYDLGYGTSNSNTPEGYSGSELMKALFAWELRRRVQEEGISVNCVMPGTCKTRLHQHTHFSCFDYPLLLMSLFFMKSAAKGSETITYCATSGKVKAGGGLFYRGKKHVEDMDQWLKSKAEGSKGLWEASARLVGIELS